jgi:isoleucyl-tRNA synthetase
LREEGQIVVAGVTLTPSDVIVEFEAPTGYVGVADRDTQLIIDTRITPELKAEGAARDVIRFVQDARKDAGLDVADKIALHLGAAGDLAAAVAAHKATIAAETQAVEWSDAPLSGAAFTAEKKVDGQPLTISLRKV